MTEAPPAREEPPTREGAQGGEGVRVERVSAANWRTYRDVRIAALIDSPRAFWATYAEAEGRSDREWEERATATGPTWLARVGERPVGTVGLWHGDEQPDDEVFLVGMWVASVARGSEVAALLVRTALAHAAASGRRRVVLDVSHENTRAWAFYVRMGFRPTGEVDAMPWDPSVTEETMVLEL